MAEDDGKLATDKPGILAELVKRVQWSVDFDSDTRTEALDDMRFVGGQQWPDQMRRTRELEARPCLTINKLPAFLHQITNDQRQNKPGIKIHPVDDGADEKTAEIIQGMIRHIEYSSNADVAYDTAVNSAAACGFGYFRLVTDYCDEKSFDQEIRFKRIRNPFTVYCGPHEEPDGSDMLWCVITSEVPRDEFRQEYPNADASAQTSWPRGSGDNAVQWLSVDSVRVAEYYRVETKPATLCQLGDGSVAWKDELPPMANVLRERPSEKRSVVWRKCTAIDVLEEQEIPGRYIPVFPVYGDELDINGRVIRSGVIRWAKDPQRMYNYWMTAATEEVSLRPKTPYIAAEGQIEGYENQWAQANTRSFAVLQYKPVTIEGTLAPAPQRQPMADMPSGVLAMAMHANDNIKATTGIFDASLGSQGNETSGKAIIARQREGDVSNFHFTDNLARTIRHCGRVLLSWIPVVYDTQRVVRMLGEDDSVDYETINQQQTQHEIDEQTGMVRAIDNVLNDVRVGQYDVTVSVGPAYSTMRQEAADAMIQFGQSWPKLMDIAGDKVVKAMDWPGAEEIAERIKRTIPPEITQDEEEGAIPPQLQMQMQQMQQFIQALQGENAQLQQAMNDKEGDRMLKKYEIDSKADQANDANAVKVLLEEMRLQMAPLQDLGQRVGEIESALTDIAGVLIPPQPQQAPEAQGFYPPEGIPQ